VSSDVDVTLIQETLALTPQQRIQQNDRVLRMIEELRDGVAKSRTDRDRGPPRLRVGSRDDHRAQAWFNATQGPACIANPEETLRQRNR
jgi:hypothetical protein